MNHRELSTGFGYLQKAWSAFELRRYQLALELVHEGLSREPNSADLHYLASAVTLRLESYRDSRTFARKLIELAPQSTLGYEALAWATIADATYRPSHARSHAPADVYEARLEEAAELLEAAVAISPVLPELFQLRAEIEFLRDQPKAALESAEEGLRYAPDSVVLRYQAIRAWRLLGHTDTAARIATEALSLAPENPTGLILKSQLELERGNTETALRDARLGIQLDPSSEEMRQAYWDAIKAHKRFLRPIVTWQFMANRISRLPTSLKNLAFAIPLLAGVLGAIFTHQIQNELGVFVVLSVICSGMLLFTSERPGMVLADLWMFATDPTFRRASNRKALFLESSLWLAAGSFFLAALAALWLPQALLCWIALASWYFPVLLIAFGGPWFVRIGQAINVATFSLLLYSGVQRMQNATGPQDRLIAFYMLMGFSVLALAGPLLHWAQLGQHD